MLTQKEVAERLKDKDRRWFQKNSYPYQIVDVLPTTVGTFRAETGWKQVGRNDVARANNLPETFGKDPPIPKEKEAKPKIAMVPEPPHTPPPHTPVHPPLKNSISDIGESHPPHSPPPPLHPPHAPADRPSPLK